MTDKFCFFVFKCSYLVNIFPFYVFNIFIYVEKSARWNSNQCATTKPLWKFLLYHVWDGSRLVHSVMGYLETCPKMLKRQNPAYRRGKSIQTVRMFIKQRGWGSCTNKTKITYWRKTNISDLFDGSNNEFISSCNADFLIDYKFTQDRSSSLMSKEKPTVW